MVRYEVLMLTVSEITEDEVKNLESQLLSVIRVAKGAPVSFERWGKYSLAYPVKKNDYGVYFLARFELPETALEALEEIRSLVNVKFHDVVIRSMVTVLDPNQPLDYERPQSLEETPRREQSYGRLGRHGDRHEARLSAHGEESEDAEEFEEIHSDDHAMQEETVA